jgi:transposase-like protein
MTRRRVTPEQRKKVVDLYRTGKPLPGIAHDTGIPFTTVRQMLYRLRKRGELGPPRKKGPTPKPKGKAVYKNPRTVVFLDTEIRRRLKVAAVLKGTSMTEIVAEALAEYFEQHPTKL